MILFFSEEFGMLVYNNAETAAYIRIMAPLIPIMYIDSTVDAILKGSGHQVYSMNVNIADTLTACLFAIFLIPRLGIWGYVISIYATEILNTSLSLIKMSSVSRIKFKIFHQVVMPIICIIGATNLSFLLIKLIPVALPRVASLIINVLLTVALYITLLVATKTVGKDEKEFLYPALMSERSYKKKFSNI
jgi:stage V sporulation protein B